MLNRRKFLKISTAALTIATTLNAKAKERLLQGVSDIHIHAAPDSKDRLSDELSIALEAKNAGYRCVCFKSNDFSSHDRAYIISKVIKDFHCFGSLVLNYTTGDKLNVFAVEKALKTSGNFCRIIWLPTQAASYQEQMSKSGKKGISVLDENLKPLKETLQIMELCAKSNIALASGHCSPKESLILAKYAKEIGLEKFIITHANSSIWKMSEDELKRAFDLGAWVEFCVLTNFWGKGTSLPEYKRMSWSEFCNLVKINPQRSFVSTDLGQVGMIHPIEGMRECILKMQEYNLSQEQIDFLVRKNPAFLMGI